MAKGGGRKRLMRKRSMRKRSMRKEVNERLDFLRLVKCSFLQRRKLLAKNLQSFSSPHQAMGPLRALEEMGWGAKVRAEELTPSEFVKLFKRIYGR